MTAGCASTTAPRIFCFAHAGGDPRRFLEWQAALGDDGELVAVGLPGRGHRVDEPYPASVASFADGAAAAIASAADRPNYLFGHSLGALLAFEVARRLRDEPMVRHLIASGCSAPCLLPTERVVAFSRLEGREFAEAAGYFGGLPPEVVAAEELHELILPSIQADFRLVADYQYRPAAPFDIPVTIVNGVSDRHVTQDAVAGWAAETTWPLDSQWVEGGHFYFDRDPGPLTETLRRIVRSPQGNHVELI